MKIQVAVTVLAALSTLSCNAISAETQIGRYTSVSNTASFAQKNLLATEIKVTFPDQVQNLKTAFELLLESSGYRLSQKSLDVDIDVLYEQPLPDVHKTLGPMSLREALQTLAGSTWALVTNPVDRTVSFKLDESYRHLVSKHRPIVSNLTIKGIDKQFSCGSPVRIESTESIYFGPNSIRLNYKDEAKLSAIADKAKSLGLGLVIKSYADPSGPEAMHIALSKARGEAVADYLKSSGANILAVDALGATFPNPDVPESKQRVAEILLVQSLCKKEEPKPIWLIQANQSLQDTLFSWIGQSKEWKALVYKVKNEDGKEVKVILKQPSQLSGKFSDVLSQLIHELRKRPGVVSLRSDLYQGDGTVVIEGLIKEVNQ